MYNEKIEFVLQRLYDIAQKHPRLQAELGELGKLLQAAIFDTEQYIDSLQEQIMIYESEVDESVVQDWLSQYLYDDYEN